MAIKINTTTVFDNSGKVDISKLANVSFIKKLTVNTVGDGTAGLGSTGCRCYSVTFNTLTGELTTYFNTDCTAPPPPPPPPPLC